MSTAKPPFDPDPSRADAFGELAREGFAGVPDSGHAERLARLRERTAGRPVSDDEAATTALRPGSARVRRLPLRWLAVAASVLLLVVAGLLLWLRDENSEQAVHIARLPESEDALESAEENSAILEAPPVVASPAPAVESSASAKTSPEQDAERAQESRSEAMTAAPDPPHRSRDLATADPQAPVSAQAAQSRARRPYDYAPAAPKPSPPVPAAADPQADAIGRESGLAPVEETAASDAGATNAKVARAAAPESRSVSGRITTLGNEVLAGVRLFVEGTGQPVTVNPGGRFEISLGRLTPVLVAVAPDHDTLYVDASQGTDFRIALAPSSGRGVGTVTSDDTSLPMAVVPPRAARNPAFESYLASTFGARSLAERQRVEVNFYVDGQGRAERVSAGPGVELTDAQLARVRELFRGGPTWPERYRQRAWRYAIVIE